jgi:hypothetical protein
LTKAKATPSGVALERDVGEQVDAAHREAQRGQVAPRPRAEHGEDDHRKELDGRHRAQRQAVDGQVEGAVHHGQDGAPGEQEADVGAAAQAAPWAPPQREDRGGRRDPQPRHPEHVDAAKSSTANAGPR